MPRPVRRRQVPEQTPREPEMPPGPLAMGVFPIVNEPPGRGPDGSLRADTGLGRWARP